MESLLLFARQLESRDAELGRALGSVERLQLELESVRAAGVATAAFLASLPGALDALADAERAAVVARADAEGALRDAKAADDEPAARDAARRLGAAVRSAGDAASARTRLERDADARRAEATRLAARAHALSTDVHGVPAPPGGLEGALEWVSQARGALLLEHSALARERDALVREASELLGSVLGEPLTSTAVAGVGDKLERALQGGAP